MRKDREPGEKTKMARQGVGVRIGWVGGWLGVVGREMRGKISILERSQATARFLSRFSDKIAITLTRRGRARGRERERNSESERSTTGDNCVRRRVKRFENCEREQ